MATNPVCSLRVSLVFLDTDFFLEKAVLCVNLKA